MRLLVVLNAKGGVGKTTVSCGLAAALAARGASVIAVDADPQGGLAAWWDLAGHSGLTNLLAGTLAPEDAAVRVAEGLAVIPIGNAKPLYRFTNRRDPVDVAPYLRPLEADYLVLDTAPAINALTLAFLRWDGSETVVPVALVGGYLPLVSVARVRELLQHETGRGPDFIVPNLLDRRVKVSNEILELLREHFGKRVTAPVRINSRLVEAAWAHRAPRDPKSREDFDALARKVGQHGKARR